MLYVQLDVNWPDNPKVIEAGLVGAGLHAVTMCIAKRLESDGWVHRSLLYRQAATDELIDQVVELGLLDADRDRVRPHDWLVRNPSQAAIDARRVAKVLAAKVGNHNRWSHPGEVADCPICYPEGQVVAGCDPIGSQDESGASRVRSLITKSETYTPTAIGTESISPEQVTRLRSVRAQVFTNGANPATGGEPSRLDRPATHSET